MSRRFGCSRLGALAFLAASALAPAALAGPSAPTTADSAPSTEPPTPAPRREPSPGDLATARAALREGLVLREKGETTAAFARLASAYDLVPTPVTGFELGKTHLMLGHVLQAHELFKKVIRMPPSMEESTRSQMSRDEAARLAKEVEPRIPSLRIRVRLPTGASAVVRVDEDTITMSGGETFRAVDPGPHDVLAKAGDGPEQKVHIEIGEGEIKDVDLSPQWVLPRNPPKDAAAKDIFVRTTNPLVYIGFSVGAVAAVASGITAFLAVRSLDSARDRCGSDYCPPNSNDPNLGPSSIGDPTFSQRTNTAAGLGLVAIVTGLGSIAFFGVGIVGLRRPIKERVVSLDVTPKPPPRPVLTPTVGAGQLGLSGTF